jgi:hypothetical protein
MILSLGRFGRPCRARTAVWMKPFRGWMVPALVSWPCDGGAGGLWAVLVLSARIPTYAPPLGEALEPRVPLPSLSQGHHVMLEWVGPRRGVVKA